MKILFITSHYLSGSAISNCLKNIFSCISDCLEIEVAHMDKSSGNVSDLSVKTHNINCVYTTAMKDVSSSGYRKMELIALKAISRMRLPLGLKYKIENKRTYDEIEKLVSENNYDCIVSVCAKFSNHYLACKLKRKIPGIKWIAYYFDPFSFNMFEKSKFEVKLKFEDSLLESADGIIITKQMEKEFTSCVLKKYLNKSVVCEFPNIINKIIDANNTTINFSREKVNCVFTGYIYGNVRDPRYFLDLLIKSDSNITFYIVGGITEQAENLLNMDYYKEQLKDRLHFVDAVSLDEAFRIMNDADILVNLGNSVKNQLPSKIFDYISMGKPIINICKYKDCLTLPYFEEYPAGLNLFEDDNINPEQVKEFEKFCIKAKNTKVPFDYIEKRYKKATPSYVADQLKDLIKK